MKTLRALPLMGLTLAGVLAFSAATVRPSDATSMRRHVRVTKSVPARNDTLAAAPKQIQIWFSEAVDLKTTPIKLVTAAGADVALSAAKREAMAGMDEKDMPVVLGITSPLAAGAYAINWAAKASDGEDSKGTIRFVVK